MSIAVTEDRKTVAAVGLMGSRAEIAERKGELAAALRGQRLAWEGRALSPE